MVNLFLATLVAGFSVTFAIEFLALLTSYFFDKEALYIVLSLPTAFGAMYLLYPIDKTMIVSVPATAFVALILNKFLNTKSMTTTKLRRL